MLSLLFTVAMASQNYFTYNNWSYGDCTMTKVDGVMFCETEEKACIVDMKALDRNGRPYVKFACRDCSRQLFDEICKTVKALSKEGEG